LDEITYTGIDTHLKGLDDVEDSYNPDQSVFNIIKALEVSIDSSVSDLIQQVSKDIGIPVNRIIIRTTRPDRYLTLLKDGKRVIRDLHFVQMERLVIEDSQTISCLSCFGF
jgi:hypothetical protein